MKRIERGIINLLKRGPLKTMDIARHYKMTEPTARRHLSNLEDRSLVRSSNRRGSYTWTLNEHEPEIRGKGERVTLELKFEGEEHGGIYLNVPSVWTRCVCGTIAYVGTKVSTCYVCKRQLKMTVKVEAWDE